MDLKLLADALVIALAPVLPHLVAGGTEAVKAAGKKLGEEAVDLGEKLWARLRKPVEESPRALGAAEEVSEAPNDDDARAGLRRQLVKILEADPDLAAEMAKLLDPAGQGTSYQASLHGSGAIAQSGGVAARQAAVGGNVHGNVNAPSIERLDVHVAAPEARDFLRGLGLGSPAPDLEAATRAYLQYLVEAYRYLDLRGMGISDRVALKLPLLEMYVPLKARLHTPEGETWARQLPVAGRLPGVEEGADMGERLSDLLPVLGLLQKHDALALLGDPGSGKTTFLKVLALALASGQGETLGLGGRLPILLPLAAYANALADRDVSLDDFIARYYEDERKIQVPLGALLARALQEGSALLLLDGLDEVRDAGRRHLMVDRVRDFYSRHRKAGKGATSSS